MKNIAHKTTCRLHIANDWYLKRAMTELAVERVDSDELRALIIEGRSINEITEQLVGRHNSVYRARLRRLGGSVDHLHLGFKPYMAYRNDGRVVRQRADLPNGTNRTFGHAVVASESRRGDSWYGAGDSALRLSVWEAAGELSAERVGDRCTNLAENSGKSLGVERGAYCRG